MSVKHADFKESILVLLSGVLWAFQPVFLLGAASLYPQNALVLLQMNVVGTFGFSLVISVFMGGWGPFLKALRQRERAFKLLKFLICDGILIALSYYFLIWASELVDAASAAIFYEAWPIFVALMLYGFSKKKGGSFSWVAMALFAFGYCALNVDSLLNLFNSGDFQLATLTVPMTAGIAMAGGVFIAQIFVRSEMDLFGSFRGLLRMVTLRSGVTSLLILVLFQPVQGGAFAGIDWRGMLVAVLFGGFVTLSSVFYHLGASRASSNAISLLSLIAPVIAPVLLLFFGLTTISHEFLVGAAFIVTGIAVTARHENMSSSFVVVCGSFLIFGAILVFAPGTAHEDYYNYLDVVAILFGLVQTSQLSRVWDVRNQLHKLHLEWRNLRKRDRQGQRNFDRARYVLHEIRFLRSSILEGIDAVVFSIVGLVAILAAIGMRSNDFGANLIAFIMSITIFFINFQIWRFRIWILMYSPRRERGKLHSKYDFQTRVFSYSIIILVFGMLSLALYLRYQS